MNTFPEDFHSKKHDDSDYGTCIDSWFVANSDATQQYMQEIYQIPFYFKESQLTNKKLLEKSLT